MTAASNRSVIDESDYQKCGEIMVATTGMFVMKCLHCPCNNIFKRLQSFMRHVHQQHSDKIKFQSNAASDLMVFAVEELVNRTLCDVDESEESGVAEDDMKWSEDEDDEEIVNNRAMKFKSLFQKGKQPIDKDVAGTQGRNKINKKPALANMSILNALEDCDVSMNFVENLDATIVENIDEEEVGEEKERKDCSQNQEIKDDESFKETGEDRESTSNRSQQNDDDDMDNGDGNDDDDDCDMNSTLMKRIQLDLDSENEDSMETHNKDEISKDTTDEQAEKGLAENSTSDEDDQNATLTEDVIKATINSSSTSNTTELESSNKSKSINDGEEKTDSSNQTKNGGLKSLLRGLDDLEDVDDLIDNIDDSIMITAKEQQEEEEDERLQDEEKPVEENKSAESKLETSKNFKELEESTECLNKMLTKEKGVPQKKVSDLELQLMADLGLDEEDLEDCLNNTYMPENTESAEKSLIVEDKDVTKSKIAECLLNDEDDANPPSNNMKEPKAAIKSRTPKAMESKELQPNNCTNDSDDISSGNKITPTSRKCRRSNSKTPKNLKKTIEKIACDEDSPKSTKRSAKKEDLKTSPTKKSKGDIEVTESKELVEPCKFEEGLSAENSSTMLCPSPKIEEVHNDNKIGNSLQSLLNRELGEDEDLDMLIDQLETSTSSQANENVENTVETENEDGDNNIEKCIEQENPVVEINVEMDVEKDVMQEKDTLADLDVDDDIELDDDMAIFNKFISRKSECIKDNDNNHNRPEVSEEDKKLNPGEESAQESKEECDADAKMKYEKSEETVSQHDKEETNEIEKSEKNTEKSMIDAVDENAEIDEIEAEDDIENDEEIEHKENDDEEIEHKENDEEEIEDKENENNEAGLEKDLQKEATSANVQAENEEQQLENNEAIETEKEKESVEEPTTQTEPIDESVTQTEHEEEVLTQGEEENLETVCGETEDLDDFENMLNEDLTKALEQALGEDNVLLNMEDEIIVSEKEHNPKEKEDSNHDMEIDSIHQEQTEEQLISPPKSKKKSPQNKNKKIASPSATVSEQPCKGKFSKTNQKARSKQGKPITGQEDITLKEVNVQPLSPKLTINQIGKCDKEALNPPKPEISELATELQENVPLEEKIIHKTPSSRRTQNKTTHISKSQIIKEKITPSRCFVNTARGEMTPLKVEDLFLKQSPKTQEKSKGKTQNKVVPKSPEDKHEKSPTQCKLDLIKAKLLKTPTTIKQTSPKSSQYQKSPTTPINQNDKSNITTPQKTRNLSVKVMRCTPTKTKSPSEFKSPPSPRKQKTPETKPSPKDLKPIPTANTSLSNAEMNSKFKLPKGITISKVPLATAVNTNPSTVDVTPSRSNYCKQNFTENSLQEPIQMTGDKTPSRRSLIKDDVATTSECSIKGDVAPTESLFLGAPSITESLIKSVPSTTESLLKSVPSSITITKTESTTSFPSRMRARQASIDIVNSRPNAAKSPKGGNLDYKSYAVSRSARKKEVLQRMRNIKKQIFKSIGTDVLGQVRTIKSPMVKKSKRSKIQIENVEILPNVQDQVLTPMLNTQNLSPQFCNGKSSDPSPKTSMTSVGKTLNSPMTAVNSPTTGLKNASESMKEVNTPSKEKSPCAKTEKDEVITKISTTPRSVASNKCKYVNLKREASSPLLEDQNPPKRLHKSPSQKIDESVPKPPTVELESTQLGLSDSVVDFLQRDLRANRLNVDSLLSEDMPVDDPTPDAAINNTDEGAANEKNSPKLDEKKLHMEKIDEEILKSDEKIEENCPKNIEDHDNQEPADNMKNSNSESPEAAILDELLEQVEEEQKPKLKTNEESDDENKNKSKVLKICEDYDDEKDLDLLEHFGLKIIKIDDIENFNTIEEVEEMQGKAKQFSTLCKSWFNVFSSKQAVTDDTFKAFLKSVNDEFETDISLCDIKRLTNLIIMWYANCYNSKLIEKKVISETTNKYLLMFFYIPKTIKRIYYCEFCEENFNTEHRYYVHRISHTGASHPYRCKHCNMGFNRVHKQKPHEMICMQIKNSNQNQRELRVAATPKKTTEEIKLATKIPTANDKQQQQRDLRVTTKQPQTATEKPQTEVKRIPISRRNSNSEHKKLPVRTVYSCAKCEMKFNSESEVKNHMAQCNRSQRRQPKMCTPRPKPKPEPYTKN